MLQIFFLRSIEKVTPHVANYLHTFSRKRFSNCRKIIVKIVVMLFTTLHNADLQIHNFPSLRIKLSVNCIKIGKIE